jgi:Rad3-related DNA helicase
MSEKILNELGKEAAGYYEDHGTYSKRVSHSKSVLANLQDSPTRFRDVRVFDPEESGNGLRPARSLEEAETGTNENIQYAKEEYDENIAEAAEFAHDNAEQLHDLAVIEAHLGGVAISVEQPITVGQQVPVRVEHPSER